MVKGQNKNAQLRAIHAKKGSASYTRQMGNNTYRYKSVRVNGQPKQIYLGKA